VICKHAGKSGTRVIRKAILAGYANRVAHRMPRHNGYKTLGPRGSLAQLHPSASGLAQDEDGLLPPWVVFHELIQTARTFITKVPHPLPAPRPLLAAYYALRP
jgi:ATP-dependent RNA helicase DHX8/PRP22